jgi:AraC-like DNA-binding protein
MDGFASNLSNIALKATDQKFYGAGTIQPDPRWHLAPHFHSVHEIIVVNQGRLHLKSRDFSITAGPGDILFYRAGFVHEETSDPESPVGTQFISFATGDPLPWLPVRLYDTKGRVRQITAWLVADHDERRAPEMRKPLLGALLGELHRICAEPDRDPWIEPILAFMRKNLARPLTLDDLACQGKMSRFAFVRKFKRLCGRTPMEELRLTRLEQARTLLLTTSLPVKAIAPAVGIGDEYQLSKLFRSHFNLTPRHLRTRGTPSAARRDSSTRAPH